MNHRRIDEEAVIEFLGEVPLLQRLPSSSLRKIAELVQVRHYDPGQHVVHKGEEGEGLYLIWDGKGCLSGSVDVVGGNHSEIQLKQYDHFGYCGTGSVHEGNIFALTKLICLVLQYENSELLQPQSIWNVGETHGSISLLEHILNLEPQEVDIFHGHTLPEAPSFRHVFGGQLIGQALAAATKTVGYHKPVHSLHSYFLIAGDTNLPIIYKVCRTHDGYDITTRRVIARQHGVTIFILVASFRVQKEEAEFEHQDFMPHVQAPETLESIEELREKHLSGFQIPVFYQNCMNYEGSGLWPIDIRFCGLNNSEEQFQPSLSYWFKVRGELSEESALHRCALAYASDFFFGSVSLKPHLRKDMKILALSLDHSICFHRPVKADDWVLFVMEAPSSCNGRGFSTGRMFNRKGELVMSLAQEALLRDVTQKNQNPQAKL